LLANIYLHPLDKYWTQTHRGWETKLVRYCDDFVVLIRAQDPRPYVQSLNGMLDRLRVELSAEKTRLVSAEEGFDFLGTRLILKPTRRDRSRRFCYGFPSPKAMNRIRQKIRAAIGREYRSSLQEKIRDLNPIVRGWANYYTWLNSARAFHKIERHVLRKLNLWNRSKQGRRRRRYRKLSSTTVFGMGLYRIGGKIAYVS
jgi:RNA-directed DNA polymerase